MTLISFLYCPTSSLWTDTSRRLLVLEPIGRGTLCIEPTKTVAGDVTAFITGVGQPMDIHGYDLTKHMTPGTYNNFVVDDNSESLLFA